LKKTGNYIFGLLLFTIVFFQFKQVFIVAHFFIYQDELAEAYCENKDKPEMQCNGKCHLKKELTEDEIVVQNSSKKEEHSNSFKVLLFNAMSFNEEVDFCFCSTLRVNLLSFAYINSHSVKHTLNFFPPPNYLS
jgi:hypothetical protein